jgi:hypothetical protein
MAGLSPDNNSVVNSSYELAYHHHLQSALQAQMGQFYNPTTDHLTAALRNNSSGGNPSSGNQNGGLIPGSCLPPGAGGGSGTLWESGLVGTQRGTLGYSPHPHQGEILSVAHGIDLWPTPVPATNGRGSGQR